MLYYKKYNFFKPSKAQKIFIQDVLQMCYDLCSRKQCG